MTVHKLTKHLLPGDANEDLAVALEDLAGRARRGEIKAVAWAGVTAGEHLITGWDGAEGTIFTLAAAVSCLQSRYVESMMELRE